MEIVNVFDIDIESFSNSGDGVGRLAGEVVFVENTCPGDKVKLELTDVGRNFVRGKVLEVLEPSPHRITPFCPMHKICGACRMQFIDYEYQLELKKTMVEDAIRKIAKLDIKINDVIPSPKTTHYRQKIQYPVCQTKNSKRIIAGYYKYKSHEIVNIKYCPIQPEICDNIIEFIRENAKKFDVSGYDEKTHKGDLRHIVIRGSEYSGKFLVTLVINSKQLHKHISKKITSHHPSHKLGEGTVVGDDLANAGEVSHIIKFAQAIFDNFEEVSGVCINYNDKKTNVILGENTQCIAGDDFVEEKILDKIFKIGADTFFQINPKSAENIFKYVKEEVSKSDMPIVLDAYAGIATFGIVVSDVSKSVVSVEANKSSIEKAKEVLEENNIGNVELFAQDTVKYLKSIKKKFDITILDPPRKGCTQEVLDEVLNHTKKEIIYVSCNPATLARDLNYLAEKGGLVKSIQPFDMFCHTPHVECVAVIEV